MLGLGAPELAVIAGLSLLIFGPRQLPRLGRALGDTIREMRGIGKQLSEPEDEDEDDVTAEEIRTRSGHGPRS